MLSQGGSFLISCFEIFYSKVLEYEVRIKQNRVFDPSASETEKRYMVETISTELLQIIEEQASNVASQGGALATACFSEVAYIMVSLADEIFLNQQWKEKKYWRNNLLEEKYFQTHSAGSKFFDNLEDFMQNRDVEKSDVGIIYLYALALGFKGKYRGEITSLENEQKLMKLKERLFRLLNKTSPQLFRIKSRLFPQTLKYTDIENTEYLDLSLRNWSIIGTSVLVIYLFAAQMIWHKGTSELWTITKESIEALRDIK